MKNLCTLSVLSLLCLHLSAQREISALRISDKINVDGKLDEAIWSTAEIATDFITWQPEAGKTPKFPTEVRIVYDDDAIYMGAYMKTDSKEDVLTQLSARDGYGNTDFIGLIIDTYGNGTQGFEFLLYSTGVQFDANVDEQGENSDWNAVWFSDVELTDDGWYAEIKIPYSALRFSSKDVQNWRVNFLRSMPKFGEKCSFQFLDPEISGFVNQTAYLKGIKDIKAPFRLSLSPYLTTYREVNKNPNADPSKTSGFSYNGGLDLKYGINDAFTLDMTLIPDFGQVQSDDEVLNLSPFEVRFNENRDFFTEGVDLFNKADLFYSRRIGGIPLNYWDVQYNLASNQSLISNPGETQLYNATKISGRTAKGLGIGFLNAVAGSTTAEIQNLDTQEVTEVTTSPLTNYNVTVVDKNLKNNSYVSLINTNVWRRGAEFYDANVLGTAFNLRTEDQKWGVRGSASHAIQMYTEREDNRGTQFDVTFGKISGVFNYEFSANGTSTNYNNNDLGYTTNTNVMNYNAFAVYSRNDAWKGFNRGNVWFNVFYNTTFDNQAYRSVHLNSGFWAQTKNQWSINMWTNYRPTSHDYFESRIPGKYLKTPGFYNMGWFVGTDSRKKLRMNLYVFGLKNFEKNMHFYELELGPRYQFNDQLTAYLSTSYSKGNNSLGWVDFTEDNESIIGNRVRNTVVNVFGANYTLNSKMSFEFRARHYWSKVRYNGFHLLGDDGDLLVTDYDSFNNFSYNFFNLDFNYRWRFAPGSDLIINWKSNISGSESDELIDYEQRRYMDGVRKLNELPQRTSISLRVIYYINGQNLF